MYLKIYYRKTNDVSLRWVCVLVDDNISYEYVRKLVSQYIDIKEENIIIKQICQI